MDIRLGGTAGVVPGGEDVVLRLTGEQRRHGVYQGGGLGAVRQLFHHRLEGDRRVVGGAQGGPHGGEAVAVLGENGVFPVQLEGLHKPLPQAHEEVQRPAQEDDPALQLPALGEAGHGLVHHRLEDGGGHVLLPPPLVEDGLDVALCEHPAAGGDWVNFLML